MSKDKRPYHELPDVAPKLLRILIQAKVLPPSAHEIFFTIFDRFNVKGELERVCFEGSFGNGRRAGYGKKQFNKVANDLVELGLLQLQYRVWLNNSKGEFKVISNYDEALKFRAECEKTVAWIKKPSLVRQYTEVEKLPTPEELGLTVIDPANHIYSSPKKIRRTGKKRPRGIEEKFHTPIAKSSMPCPQESDLNGTNSNDTNSNETNPMVISIPVGVGEIPKTSPLGSLSISTPPPSENFLILMTELEKRFEREPGHIKVPKQQLRAVMLDESIKAAIEENIATVIEAGGAVEGWVDCEFDRMKRNVGKEYRAPQLKFFGNVASLNEYLDKLRGQSLLREMNPFSDYLNQKELHQCLSIAPEDDLLLIRYQVLLRAYMNASSRSEVSAALEMLPTYAHFFELTPKAFLYVGIKYVTFKGQRSKHVHLLAKRFSDESGDTSLISILKNRRLKKLISSAKEHLQSH